MNDRVIIRAGIVGIVFFVLLGMLDGFIALPLREASSWISFQLLDAVSFPVEKVGTLLKTPRMDFDVVPACSGSTTLRVMIFVGIVWTAMQDKMSTLRKTLLLIPVIPLAVLSNGIRVSILVIIGYSMYKPVEGILHELIGIATFVMAFGGLLAVTRLLSTSGDIKSDKSSVASHVAGIICLFVAVYYQFAFWCFNGWKNSPLDHYGFIFVVAAFIGIVYIWRKYETVMDGSIIAGALALISLLIFSISIIADINILAGVSFVLFLIPVLILFKGKSVAIKCLPFVAIIVLGMPTVTFMVNKILVTAGLPGSKLGVLVKVVVAIALGFVGVCINKGNKEAVATLSIQGRRLYLLPCILTLMLVVKLTFNSSDVKKTHPGKLNVSYVLGDWVGKKSDNFQMNPAIPYQDTWIRLYTNGDHEVSMTVTASGGDRHQLHPPEYCLTGGGWTLRGEQKVNYAFLSGVDSEVTEMFLDKHEAGSYFVYWFTDGRIVFPNYRSMLAEDTLRRLKNIQTKWFLFRFIAPSKEVMFEQFLPNLEGDITVDGKEYVF